MDPLLDYHIGVDVGSASIRIGVFDFYGQLIYKAVRPLKIFSPNSNIYMQSSDNIWLSFIDAFKEVLQNVNSNCIKSISFAATCSLVILDHQSNPINAFNQINSQNTDEEIYNIIMWMDHRADQEANYINSVCCNDEVLRSLGGKISLEMQIPKLLWLKRNLTKWKDIGMLLDLADFMRYKATGILTRSVCTSVCKWNYQFTQTTKNSLLGEWPGEFYTKIGIYGLPELSQRNALHFRQKPYFLDGVKEPLTFTNENENEILLSNASLIVGPSMIDAHAGSIGLLTSNFCSQNSKDTESDSKASIDSRMPHTLVLMTGTSNCLLISQQNPAFVEGIWGPYYSAIFTGFYTHEGGQTFAGKSFDVLFNQFLSLNPSCGNNDKNTNQSVNPNSELVSTDNNMENYHTRIEKWIIKHFLPNQTSIDCSNIGPLLFDSTNSQAIVDLTRHIHIWPDFAGNRSPFSDPDLRGMIIGLDVLTTNSMVALYIALMQALAMGVRLIISKLITEGGYEIEAIHIGGGLCHNILFAQIVADVTGKIVIVPANQEHCVMLGIALMGAYIYEKNCLPQSNQLKVFDIMERMKCDGQILGPYSHLTAFYAAKYEIFLDMHRTQLKYRNIMNEISQ